MMKFGPHTIKTKGTLYEAADYALANHWRGTRWGNTVQAYLWPMIAWLQQEQGVSDLEDLTREKLGLLLDSFTARGNSRQTIDHKVGVLKSIYRLAHESGMSVVPFPELSRYRMKTAGKQRTNINRWWLKPELLEQVCTLLMKRGATRLSLYILWTCLTGLRVEENLRLEFNHLDRERRLLNVPWGERTKATSAPVILSDAALLVFDALLSDASGGRDERLFPITLVRLREQWNEHFIPIIKDTLTEGQTPQLRDLRATFATMLNLKGMPLDTLRRLMRHSKVSTTIGYLRDGGDLQKQQALIYMNADTREDAEVKLSKFTKSLGWNAGDVAKVLKRRKTNAN